MLFAALHRIHVTTSHVHSGERSRLAVNNCNGIYYLHSTTTGILRTANKKIYKPHCSLKENSTEEFL